jgi:integrase
MMDDEHEAGAGESASAAKRKERRERGGWCRHKRTGQFLFYYRVNGKRVFRQAATEEDAKRGLRKALKDLDKGIATTPAEERLTAKKLFEGYRDSLSLEGRLSPTERWLFDVAVKAFGHYRMPMLEDGRIIRKWTVAERERTTDAWAPSTINRFLAFVRAAFKLAEDEGIIKRAPAVKLVEGADNVRKVYFDAALFGRFLAALRALNEDYADAVSFAYLSGNRKGAIAKLRFDQIDRVRKEIRYPSRAANKPDPDVVTLTGELAELIERRFERRSSGPTLVLSAARSKTLPSCC